MPGRCGPAGRGTGHFPRPCSRARQGVATQAGRRRFSMAGAGSSGAGFVHLHVHTEYSMLDGAARLRDLFAACQTAGMPAVAITDHGNVYGAYDFWAKAGAAGIKPIIGIEAYVAPEHRRVRAHRRRGTPPPTDAAADGGGAT